MGTFDIDQTEYATLSGLKDFQRKTVNRIYHLYHSGQRRVLVADEVGMGKTLIARGVIARTARLRIEEKDDLFKVVYICSNISIANQNIQKLKVSDTATIEGISDTRLSMQHLKITQQEEDQDLRDGYIQLIPLTPDTSFRMTNGGGTVNERALMFAVLRRMTEIVPYEAALRGFLQFYVSREDSWNYYIDEYEKRVRDCEEKTGGRYPSELIDKIRKHNDKEPVIDMLLEHLSEHGTSYRTPDAGRIIANLRAMFARISTEMLQPDLVIMDEFQRFKFLINSEENSETGILARKFLGSKDTRILLLSATPYKLYSTLDEIDEASGVDEHYQEFLQVMDFLFQEHNQGFRKVWSDYNIALHEMKNGDSAILQIKKEAEDAMYQGVCRTERISVMESGDYTDDSSVKKPLDITPDDIRAFLAMGKLLKKTESGYSLPVDYAKSSPFLMSFMKNYKVKQDIEKYFQRHPDQIAAASDKLLWVDPGKVNRYKSLPKTNARLEKLKEVAFENHAELFLWIPPCRPYYEMQGAYRRAGNYSKVLIFSSWEMVPRMIGAMISYEAERLTVGAVCASAEGIERRNASYYAKNRYPYNRLEFKLDKNQKPQRMPLLCLLYPSKTLAEMYDPIASMNANERLIDVERRIREQIRIRLKELSVYQKLDSRNEDNRWYYLAPILMDQVEFAKNWIDAMKDPSFASSEDGEEKAGKGRRKNAFPSHIERLEEYIQQGEELSLGRMPENLSETLTDMVLGSPAVCVYRSNGGNAVYATELARTFLNYFDTTESTAIIQLAAEKYHRKRSDDNAHWQDVLLYCKDGCFQAMFDEYRHLVSEAAGFSSKTKREERIQDTMLKDLRSRTASYDVDTYQTFRDRINGGSKKKNQMRAHFAVGFLNSEGADNQKTAGRKDSIRGAFNSPLKPFVLATTSIGQEGLDFHYYCRRIMHWNLPSNPIDLEQREGRINRFKCLAIRQNVADKYGYIEFHKNPWEEMFAAAEAERADNQSELVPYWCFGKNQSVKIERIVPMYPMSKDEIDYERLIKILSLYRLTLGQARQEELLEYLFKECKNPEELKNLFIDLSPFSKETKRLANMPDTIYNDIFIRYMNNFSLLNNAEHREYFKREMVQHFKDTWNAQSEDYPAMLKESIQKHSSVFLDDRYNCPANGMVKLVSHPEALEEVKALFEMLFSDDAGDLDKRQSRIEDFVDRCNELLDIYEPGKWKYKQSFRTALAYLTFYDPAHNYFYKATESHQMAEILDFGGDIGYGQNFKLRNYYRMCDMLVEQVRQCEELLEMNRKLIAEVNAKQPALPLCDYDEEHLLVFDIIWAGKYEIYSDIYYPIRDKRVVNRKNPNASRVEELNRHMEEQKEILDKLLLERGSYDNFSAVGMNVVHRAWGSGTIIEQDGNHIIVQLEEQKKEFQLPGAFTSGFLSTEDYEVKEIMLKIDELDQKISSVKNTLTSDKLELDGLEKKK